MIWFAVFIYALMIAALIWIWVDIIRLFVNKEFRKCPPLVPSFGKQKKIMIERIDAQLQKSERPFNVLDPGCGTGTLLIELARKHPQHRFVGIEWNVFTAAVAAFRTRKLTNVRIIRQDMFNCSFKDFDIIACFLMQPLMERFGQKLKTDGSKGTVVYSNSFYIPGFRADEIIEVKGFYKFNNIYVYKIPQAFTLSPIDG